MRQHWSYCSLVLSHWYSAIDRFTQTNQFPHTFFLIKIYKVIEHIQYEKAIIPKYKSKHKTYQNNLGTNTDSWSLENPYKSSYTSQSTAFNPLNPGYFSLQWWSACYGTSLSYHELTHWGRVTHICASTTLLQIMACRLDGTKPLSKPMLEYCSLDP